MEQMKTWNLARLELAADLIEELQDEATLRIRGARAAGATMKEISVASRLSEGQIRKVVQRR